MKLPTSAFTLTDWSEVAAAEHPGETGTSVWRTASSGDLRVLWSIIPRATPRGHCQSKFYTACSRARPGWSCTVFAHESWTRSAGFDAENGPYLCNRGKFPGKLGLAQAGAGLTRVARSGILGPGIPSRSPTKS